MIEKPILFTAPMIRAILDGRKTQTRRLFKDPERLSEGWLWAWINGELYAEFGGETSSPDCLVPYAEQTGKTVKCPYGVPGDRLRLLSTWAVGSGYDGVKPTDLPRMDSLKFWSLYDGTEKPEWCGKLRPGRFMPLWLRERMPLAVNDGVRVERLQDISEADALAEGIRQNGDDPSTATYDLPECDYHYLTARNAYLSLWDSINAKRGYGWAVNPWVWCVEFSRVEQ